VEFFNEMKILINLIAINLLCGCAINHKWEKGFHYSEINDNQYWKVPCVWDGTVMKKKPQLTK
jgi:hypothetical protein